MRAGRRTGPLRVRAWTSNRSCDSCVDGCMRLAIALAASIAAIPVSADTSLPAAACAPEDLSGLPADGPLELELQFGISRHMGCSLSWESTSDYGTLSLAIDTGGEARVSIESTHSTVFGSQGGPMTRNQSQTKLAWQGRARRNRDAVL